MRCLSPKNFWKYEYTDTFKFVNYILSYFSGQCEDGNPCAQNCYNIHNEMYECDCNRGYVLSDNGYSCIGKFPIFLKAHNGART